MSFKLGDIVIDHIQYGLATKKDGTPLYALTQLNDATIDVSSESTDAVDNRGNLIKRFYQSKTGELTATNAMVNVNVIGAASGEDPQYATNENPIDMPKIIVVEKGKTATLTDAVEGTVRVAALSNSGQMGRTYAQHTEATATQFGFTGGKVLTPPTDEAESRFIVSYKRKSKEGMKISNKADKFPDTVSLTLKVLACDPCQIDTLKAAYVVIPSFQVSPEVSISFTTDATIDYSGQLQVDYCGTEKVLYEIYWANEDEED